MGDFTSHFVYSNFLGGGELSFVNHLARGGSVNLTIDGTNYTYGSMLSLGTTVNSYYCIYLIAAQKQGTAEFDMFFTMGARGGQFDPTSATWKKLS